MTSSYARAKQDAPKQKWCRKLHFLCVMWTSHHPKCIDVTTMVIVMHEHTVCTLKQTTWVHYKCMLISAGWDEHAFIMHLRGSLSIYISLWHGMTITKYSMEVQVKEMYVRYWSVYHRNNLRSTNWRWCCDSHAIMPIKYPWLMWKLTTPCYLD